MPNKVSDDNKFFNYRRSYFIINMFKGFEILTLCGNNTHHADLFSLQNYEFSKSSRAFFASQIPWSANLSRASFGSSGCPFSAAFLYHLTASS